jgi:hypothetical protein
VVQLRAELVAKEASVSLGTARKYLNDLVANGYLEKGKLRTYTVLLNNEPRPWGTRAPPGGARVAQALAPAAPSLDPERGYVFVREGTRAWDAWCKAGHSRTLSTRRTIDGRTYTGWYQPSLFPASHAEAASPSTKNEDSPPAPTESSSLMTEADWHEFKP